MNISNQQMAAAEKAVRQRAAEEAYKVSENIEDGKMQRKMYELVFGSICIGARLYEEELMNLNKKEE